MSITEKSAIVRDHGSHLQVTLLHATESKLIFEVPAAANWQLAMTPVSIRGIENQLNVRTGGTVLVLLGKLIEWDHETIFRVIPELVLQELLEGKKPEVTTWRKTTMADLDILIRDSWSAASPLLRPYANNAAVKATEELAKQRGAKFVQIGYNADMVGHSNWGIDHLVYALKDVADPEFAGNYLYLKRCTREVYDFTHRRAGLGRHNVAFA